MGKWCLHASSFIFDQIVIKVAGNQDRHKSSDEFDFGPLVSMAHLYVFWNEIWPWHIGLRWAIVALWATCFIFFIYLPFLMSCLLPRTSCLVLINRLGLSLPRKSATINWPVPHDLIVDWAVKLQHKQTRSILYQYISYNFYYCTSLIITCSI